MLPRETVVTEIAQIPDSIRGKHAENMFRALIRILEVAPIEGKASPASLLPLVVAKPAEHRSNVVQVVEHPQGLRIGAHRLPHCDHRIAARIDDFIAVVAARVQVRYEIGWPRRTLRDGLPTAGVRLTAHNQLDAQTLRTVPPTCRSAPEKRAELPGPPPTFPGGEQRYCAPEGTIADAN